MLEDGYPTDRGQDLLERGTKDSIHIYPNSALRISCSEARELH